MAGRAVRDFQQEAEALGGQLHNMKRANEELRTERDTAAVGEQAWRKKSQEHQARADAADNHLAEIRDQFSDLKTRLHAAELANQHLMGYIARVQEDDVAREELVTIGDPQGEQRMVPKRQHKQFERPDDFTQPRHEVENRFPYHNEINGRRQPRHWITY